MAQEKVITLSNLTQYDAKLKQWVSDQILNHDRGLVFINYADLPPKGEDAALYITEDAIYKWDSSLDMYIKITGNGDAELVWKPIK